MFPQTLVKRHCYNKRLRTCNINGPFRDILADGRRITMNAPEYLSALNFPF
jgi:hypothetical protein